MSQLLTIAGEEWRLWRRSRLAVAAIWIFAALLIATSLFTGLRMSEAEHAREHQQQVAEDTFLSQPDRHPHRMVHYGHYAFRPPAPLSIIDPGVDAVTGQSIFLEGHRQNTAMFAEERAGANFGGLGSLTPAKVYQLLIPLLLIAIGHGVIVREREARTLAPVLSQGISGAGLYLGKWTALAGMAGISLLPLAIASLWASANGEALGISLSLIGAYAAYLFVWVSLIVLVSLVTKSRGVALGVLVLIWLVWAMIVPRVAVASATSVHAAPSKIETDLKIMAEKRALGDGHNTADPAFDRFRANLLAQYDVDDVADLPVNFRGLVAEKNEADLTDLMNKYAEQKMAVELRQSQHLQGFGWLSPLVATASASRSLASTGLNTHHRFLRETEALRIDFVQGLNRAHVEELSYADDINRNKGTAESQRARISAENWKVLSDFEFKPAPAAARWSEAASPLFMLLAWFVGLTAAGILLARRIKP